MTDTYLIEKLVNADFRINPPTKHEDVLIFKEVWEGIGSLGNTVLRHNGKVYLYTAVFRAKPVRTKMQCRQPAWR